MQLKVDENNYKATDLVSFKIALNNSYIAGSDRFEPIEGSVETNGITYQFVKKRVFNDTLEVVCLPNTKQSKIRTLDLELQKQLLDLTGSGAGKSKRTSIQSGLQDLSSQNHFDLSIINFWNTLLYPISSDFSLAKGYLSFPERPPIA